MINFFLNLTRKQKKIFVIAIDFFLFIFALWASFSLRLEQVFVPNFELLLFFIFSAIVGVICLNYFNIYKIVMSFIDSSSYWRIFQSVLLYGSICGLFIFIFKPTEIIPRSVIFLNIIISAFIISLARLSFISIQRNFFKNTPRFVVIYGAGDAGRELNSSISQNNSFKVVAFIDDDEKKQGTIVQGVEVLSPNKINYLINKYELLEFFLAISSINIEVRSKLILKLKKTNMSVKAIPTLDELLTRKVSIKDLHEVDLNDLLGRKQIISKKSLLKQNIDNKSVLVTGAGGSIGSEICRQAVKIGVKRLVLFEQNEFFLYQIEKELINYSLGCEIIPILGTITNRDFIQKTCRNYEIETFFHAAAYKHVPMVEKNIFFGAFNNIFGTLYSVEAAVSSKVRSFTLISSDKAVRPTNVMGATKRISEQIVNYYDSKSKNISLSSVRFGNVIGSSGSVLPLFQAQIRSGGPVTVTHKKVTRFFMTISEAVGLVIQSSSLAKGGEVFLLDMGKPISIDDLARKLITLSGYGVKNETNNKDDIEIVYTGLREGEKLFEELLIGEDSSTTAHKSIFMAKESGEIEKNFKNLIANIQSAIVNEDKKNLLKVFAKVVDGFDAKQS